MHGILKDMEQTKSRAVTNWHKHHQESRTRGQRIADAVSQAAGSWMFLIIHAIWFFVWIIFKVEPFPYGLLTMIVSLEAIFLSTFILISEKRQSDRDHYQAQQDFDTNLAAKEEIEGLMRRLDDIEENKLNKILKLLEER